MVCFLIIMIVCVYFLGVGLIEGMGVVGIDVIDWFLELLDFFLNELVDLVGLFVLKKKEIVVCCKIRNKLFKYLKLI